MLTLLEFLLRFLFDFFARFPLLVTQISLEDLSRTSGGGGFSIKMLPQPHFSKFVQECVITAHRSVNCKSNPPPPAHLPSPLDISWVRRQKWRETWTLTATPWSMRQRFYCQPSLPLWASNAYINILSSPEHKIYSFVKSQNVPGTEPWVIGGSQHLGQNSDDMTCEVPEKKWSLPHLWIFRHPPYSASWSRRQLKFTVLQTILLESRQLGTPFSVLRNTKVTISN